MLEGEFKLLAVYNSELARGIVHTPEWQERMISCIGPDVGSPKRTSPNA